MPTVDLDGTSIFYRQYGDRSRSPVVLVHGAGGTLMHWPSSLRRLSGYAVYALDLPGHGASPGSGCASIEAYAAAVLAWMDALGLTRAALIGHSMGGAIAQTVALTAPARLTALGLVATGARLPVSPALLTGLQEDYSGTVQRIARWAYARGVDDAVTAVYAEHLQKSSPALVYQDFIACDRFDMTDRLGTVKSPTLVLCGTADRMTPPAFSTELAASVPRADLHTVADAGHMVMLEEPECVTRIIEEFLNQHHGSG